MSVQHEENIDFLIMAHKSPMSWQPSADERRKYEQLRKVFDVVDFGDIDGRYARKIKDGEHPGLRYEDIIGFLLVKATFASKENKTGYYRVARQYANQAMKRICLNCRYGMSIDLDSSDPCFRPTCDSLADTSSAEFAKDIISEECHKNCTMCRVGHTIYMGNSVESFVKDPQLKINADQILLWQNRYYRMKSKHTILKARFRRQGAALLISKKLEIKVGRRLKALRKKLKGVPVTDELSKVPDVEEVLKLAVEKTYEHVSDQIDKELQKQEDSPDILAKKEFNDFTNTLMSNEEE